MSSLDSEFYINLKIGNPAIPEENVYDPPRQIIADIRFGAPRIRFTSWYKTFQRIHDFPLNEEGSGLVIGVLKKLSHLEQPELKLISSQCSFSFYARLGHHEFIQYPNSGLVLPYLIAAAEIQGIAAGLAHAKRMPQRLTLP